MKDRVPLYPGRVKLEPVAGQANTYDMTRADQPQQEGTKLNKANLLTDETVVKIWPDESERPADPTPNDALAALVRPEKTAVGSYVGTGDNGGDFTYGTYTSKDERAVIRVGDVLLKLEVSGIIRRSDDGGDTWTQIRAAQTNKSWSSMCYGNGIVVAVGTNITAWSEDLETWTNVVNSFGLGIPVVAYGNNRFVMVGFNDFGAAYSTDGKSFISATQPPSNVRGPVAFGNGMFVCVGQGSNSSNRAAYSLDGDVWTEVALPGYYIINTALSFVRNEFLAIGKQDATYCSALKSSDGKVWVAEIMPTPRNIGNALPGPIAYDETLDIACFFLANNTENAVYTQIFGENNVFISIGKTPYISAYGAVGYNGKFIVACYVNLGSSNYGTGAIVNPVLPVHIPTDFTPKFCIIYKKNGQPWYNNDGIYIDSTLYVTSEQGGIATDNTSGSTATVYAHCAEDGVYVYNWGQINTSQVAYTWFAAG